MKRLIAVTVLLLLAISSQAAWGAKKGPKPYKSEEVTLAVAHPVFYSASGSVNSITAKDFENSCATPASNGVDAYVFEVPKDYQKITAEVSAIGSGNTPAAWDLDIYLYDANCQTTLAFQTEGAPGTPSDENGIIPKGTAWILIQNYLGEPGLSAHIELAPYKVKV